MFTLDTLLIFLDIKSRLSILKIKVRNFTNIILKEHKIMTQLIIKNHLVL